MLVWFTRGQTIFKKTRGEMMIRPNGRIYVTVLTVLICGLFLGYKLAGVNSNPSSLFLKQSAARSSPNSDLNRIAATRVQVGYENNTAPAATCKRLWQQGTSPWFDGKFQASLLPVWMRENMELPLDVAQWWMSLQGGKDRNYLDALTKAFEVIPSSDRFSRRNMSTCLRCAVVGNSGNLRGSKYGILIDSNDAVIRINQARTHGFEDDVGRKDTHRLMYPESFTDIPANTNFILLNFKVLDLRWATSALTTGEITRTYQSVRPRIKVPPSNVLLYNPALMWHIYQDWIDRKGRYPSSGVLALFFAIQHCDEVNVFGFGANSNGYWDHYWQRDDGGGNSAFLKTHVHDSNHELEIIERLAKEMIITIYKGIRS